MIKSFIKNIFTKLKNTIRYVFSVQFSKDIFHWLKNLTVLRLVRALLITFFSLVILAAVGLFALIHYPATQIPEYEPIVQHVYLNQGWGATSQSELRQKYYYTPQGTSVKGIEYDWFVHMEMPWGQEKFADPNHMQAYGFIVESKPSQRNPHLLPIGFTKHFSKIADAELLDITCAACHNGQLNITKDGTRYGVQVDGGQAMHAFTTMKVGHFIPTLLAAMTSTYLNPFKFERFAKNVLGEHYNTDSKLALRERFGTVIMRFLKQGYNDASKGLYPLEEGFGRTDALARIGNTVFGDNLAEENYHIATGPVSYPPVWNIWKFDWVQYGASVKQPMARNMGEALGVGAHIAFTDPYGKPLPKDQRFNSSVMPENIHSIETTLQQLTPPQWPEKLFGKVDKDKAELGKALFNKHCVGCHGPHKASEMMKKIDTPLKSINDPLWIVSVLPIQEIGTDPNAAFNFVNNRFDLTKTGLTDTDIENTVRPIHVKQLKRLVDSAIPSERLSQFLSTKHPQPSLLITQTNWVKENPDAFNKVWKKFSNWQSYYNKSLATLNDDIATLGDETIQEDIKTSLVKKQLSNIYSVIDSLNVNALTVGEALNITGIIIREKYYKDQNFSEAKQACLDGFGSLDMPQQPLAYKARPLEGIWATPPFLHNGSVPNIYQLLSPVTERDQTFFVGRREYDTINLGYVTTPLSKSGFWFNTQLSGNFNIGHEFRAGYVPWKYGNEPQFGVIGPELTPDERLQIIEYLKIHKDSPNEMPPTPQTCEAL